MNTTTYQCASCGAPFPATRPASTCSVVCRKRNSRADIRARRLALAADAESALTRGDIDALQNVARRTVSLLGN